MIITRTPLRITLGGGGTDLPSYYRRSGHGFLIAAAITKYVFIAVNRNFDDDILLKYSAVERVPTCDDVDHPLLRECLRSVGSPTGLEISSMADIPAGTGLGSSGAFTVGTLHALRMYQHEQVTNVDLASEACDIEIERLTEPVGKQDQYIAALGGVAAFTFRDDESVSVERLEFDRATRSDLEDNLLLFYTGVRRSASEVLGNEQTNTPSSLGSGSPASGNSLSDNHDRTRAIGYETRDALLDGDLRAFAGLLTRQWHLKYERQPGPIHDTVDNWIRAALGAGALGGKLVGAGGGGFLLVYAEEKAGVRRAMAAQGLEEVRFDIDYEGTTALVAR